MSEVLDQWDEAEGTQEINLEQVDSLVQTYKEAREDYDAKKKISNQAYALVEEAKSRLISVLVSAKKSKYHVDGLGSVSVIDEYKVRTPKDLESKAALFEYLKKAGEETFLGLASIHSGTLNSFYNAEKKAAAEAGDAGFTLPGVEEPTLTRNIRFTKEK